MQMLETNVPMLVDSYKISHHRIYVNGVEELVSYLEARAPSEFSDKTVFFGLQYILKRHFVGNVVKERDLPRIKAFCKYHFMGDETLFNEAGWRYIINKRNGLLPLSIHAVPEGTVVPISNILACVRNTDKECYWLINYVETLLMHVWYAITCSSQSRTSKEDIYKFMKETVDDELIPILLPSRLHDFGYRGVSSFESAAISGAAHLVNFAGTDNIAAIELINQFYNGSEFEENMAKDEQSWNSSWSFDESYNRWDDFYKKNMPAFSIPATEHSIMTIKGPNGEKEVCRRLLEEFPNGFVACVSDSYDLFDLCANVWGGELKEKVLNRNGVLVVRPDSGDPAEVVVKVLNILGEKFGTTLNKKGYKVLDPHIRIIQGDGINVKSIPVILWAMQSTGWSAENIAFGSGGALLQKVHRDTFAFAFKACSSVIDGQRYDVYKSPKTGSGKISKRGELALVRDENGEFKTVPLSTANNYPGGNQLVEVFRNGSLIKEWNFSEIRKRAEIPALLV